MLHLETLKEEWFLFFSVQEACPLWLSGKEIMESVPVNHIERNEASVPISQIPAKKFITSVPVSPSERSVACVPANKAKEGVASMSVSLSDGRVACEPFCPTEKSMA